MTKLYVHHLIERRSGPLKLAAFLQVDLVEEFLPIPVRKSMILGLI